VRKHELRTVGSVQPWLVANAVWEPAIGATDGQVENEVKRYREGVSSATGESFGGWSVRWSKGAELPRPTHGLGTTISCEAFDTVLGNLPRWKKGTSNDKESMYVRRLST
jgi:hypothetical protein